MSRARGLFVTATDTHVGKTVVTAALGHALQIAGRRVAVLKPVQSGYAREDPPGDSMRLRDWLALDIEADQINVYALERPLAPLVAARELGQELALAPIVERARSLAGEADVVLVEGAGGLMVPVGEAWTIADLALALGYPLVVVARAGLGTVNHSLLTVRVARSLGLRVAAVVLNSNIQASADDDPSLDTNAGLIAEFGDVPVLGPLPWLGATPDGDKIRDRHAPLLEGDSLLELCEAAR